MPPLCTWSISKVMFVISPNSYWSCLILPCSPFLPLFLYVVCLPLYISSCHHSLLLTIVLVCCVFAYAKILSLLHDPCSFSSTFLSIAYSPLYMGLLSLLLQIPSPMFVVYSSLLRYLILVVYSLRYVPTLYISLFLFSLASPYQVMNAMY